MIAFVCRRGLHLKDPNGKPVKKRLDSPKPKERESTMDYSSTTRKEEGGRVVLGGILEQKML